MPACPNFRYSGLIFLWKSLRRPATPAQGMGRLALVLVSFSSLVAYGQASDPVGDQLLENAQDVSPGVRPEKTPSSLTDPAPSVQHQNPSGTNAQRPPVGATRDVRKRFKEMQKEDLQRNRRGTSSTLVVEPPGR